MTLWTERVNVIVVATSKKYGSVTLRIERVKVIVVATSRNTGGQ